MLNPESCYQALLAHDPRFDGVFFIAVKTTKIYCRNVCRVKVPLFKNVTFYSNAATAESAGYRPCLRCRPELAPGNATVDAVSRLAALALNRIEDGALDELGIEGLSQQLGVSSRHLRRVVESEFGVPPIQLVQTQRLLLAKRLLTDTCLPITEIAFASGFASVRRFNSLFLERYKLNPSQLRKRVSDGGTPYLVCEVSYREPYDWQAMLQFLRGRACPGVELVTEDSYMRTAVFGKHSGWLAIRQNAEKRTFSIQISNSLAPKLLSVVARCKRLLDAQADPKLIAATLGQLASENEGLRLPGAFFGFELALRAVLGQQVSVKAASTLHGRLAQKFGVTVETPFSGLDRAGPTADLLADLSVDELSGLGLTGGRIKTILALSKAVSSGDLSLEPGQDIDSTCRKLKNLPGVGDWTAEYISMRALGWPDALPYSDLGLKKALGIKNEKQIIEYVERYRPWRSYAVMHLWKSLEKRKDDSLLLHT